MTLFYYDDLFLRHETGSHPENARRLTAVLEHAGVQQLVGHCTRPQIVSISDERLERVHAKDLTPSIAEFISRGGGQIETDTVVSEQSLNAARGAAGAVCDAVARVLHDEDSNAFCLVRPPGHHALPDSVMGFCLINHVAIAAQTAISEFGLDRLLIVDWDVHHGNGTQSIFWESPRVGFFSIHRWPFYPGSGDWDETGVGDGLGWTKNVPVRYPTFRTEYMNAFRSQLETFADHVRPQLVLVSAGFDSHRQDPIGSLGLESEDFRELTQIVLDIASTHAGGRLISVLEGGYHPLALAESVSIHLSELVSTSSTVAERR